jgi:hypothetical protein
VAEDDLELLRSVGLERGDARLQLLDAVGQRAELVERGAEKRVHRRRRLRRDGRDEQRSFEVGVGSRSKPLNVSCRH